MNRFLKKIGIFFILAWALSYPIYYVLDKFQAHYFVTQSKVRWAMELQDKHVDYVFLGSSRMANTVAGHQFDSALGCSSINLATAGSSYGESYVLFDQYLKHGNKTKTLVLSLDLFKSKHADWDAEVLHPLVFKHFDLDPWSRQTDVIPVYKDHTEAWRLRLWEYLPISRYIEFNQYFKVDHLLRSLVGVPPPPTPFDSINGEQLIYRHTFKGKKTAQPGTVQLGPRGEKYLLAILALAKKQHINTILVTAPYFQMKAFDRKYHNTYVDFLKENYNVAYLDFTAPKVWTKATYFSDAIHTNDIGSRLFTHMLSDSLKITH